MSFKIIASRFRASIAACSILLFLLLLPPRLEQIPAALPIWAALVPRHETLWAIFSTVLVAWIFWMDVRPFAHSWWHGQTNHLKNNIRVVGGIVSFAYPGPKFAAIDGVLVTMHGVTIVNLSPTNKLSLAPRLIMHFSSNVENVIVGSADPLLCKSIFGDAGFISDILSIPLSLGPQDTAKGDLQFWLNPAFANDGTKHTSKELAQVVKADSEGSVLELEFIDYVSGDVAQADYRQPHGGKNWRSVNRKS